MTEINREAPRSDEQPPCSLTSDLQSVIAEQVRYPELAERQQRAAERLMDDERLTSDLTDDQAQPLMEWAMYQIALAAGNPACSDHQLEEITTALRRTIFQVSMIANETDEHDGERLVALANEMFHQAIASETTPE